MSAIGAKAIVAFSSLLLLHSCYSAHEYSTLNAHLSSSSDPATLTSSSSSSPQLPADIILETLVGVSLLCVGIVLNNWELKPISLRTWAGKLERKEVGRGDKKGEAVQLVPYGFLEERRGYADVRAQRKEFIDWVKENDLRSAMED